MQVFKLLFTDRITSSHHILSQDVRFFLLSLNEYNVLVF